MGYMLMGMSTGTLLGAHAFFIYMIIYLITMFTFFGLILSLRKKTGKDLTYLIEFLQIQQAHPILRCTTILVLFSMTGIPPLIGFFSKFYIFLSVVDTQSFILVIIGMLCSTLSAFYYIRLIKIMNFDQPHW
jgi:NADH-quinone oxidoreductase subunit N